MFDAKILLKAVLLTAGAYAVAVAVTSFVALTGPGWWLLLVLAVLAFYVVLAL